MAKPVKKQTTDQGYEIPIPSKNDVMADLAKVAPKKSRTGRSKKKR